MQTKERRYILISCLSQNAKPKLRKKRGNARDICLIIAAFRFSIRRKKRTFDLSNCNPDPIRFLWHPLSLHNEIKRFLT